eukprot:383927_1
MSVRSIKHSSVSKISNEISINSNASINSSNNKSVSKTNKKLLKLKQSDSDVTSITAANCSVVDSFNLVYHEHKQQIKCKSDQVTLSVSKQCTEIQFLNQNGYSNVNKILKTLQGELFEAKTIVGSSVVIKKTNKVLYLKQIAPQNGMNIIVEENICKEALILHYLTQANRPTNDYIVKFVRFLETKDAFYLVSEKANGMTLADFNQKAHQLIAGKKLKVKFWRKIVKYIFWQLSSIIYWLHEDMKCCHLDLNLNNIMVCNADFIEHEDGTITVDTNINIKLIDFGLSEIFKHCSHFDTQIVSEETNDFENSIFRCTKHGIIDKHYLCAPKVFNDEPYLANKSDIWNLGIILYELATGDEPYKSQCGDDIEFNKIVNGNILELIKMNGKTINMNAKMIDLISNILNTNENKRFECNDIIKHEWLNLYYIKYKSHIEKKSQHQLLRNESLQKKNGIISLLSIYKLNPVIKTY